MSDFLGEINKAIDERQDQKPVIREPISVNKEVKVTQENVTQNARPKWMDKPYVAPHSVETAPKD